MVSDVDLHKGCYFNKTPCSVNFCNHFGLARETKNEKRKNFRVNKVHSINLATALLAALLAF